MSEDKKILGSLVKGKPCVDCCEAGRHGLELAYRQHLSQLLQFVSDGDPDLSIALVPPVLPVPDIRIPVGPGAFPTVARPILQVGRILGPLVLPSVLVMAGAWLSEAASRRAAIETATAALLMLEPALRQARDTMSCEECVRKNLLSQGASRQRQTVRINRRLGGAYP